MFTFSARCAQYSSPPPQFRTGLYEQGVSDPDPYLDPDPGTVLKKHLKTSKTSQGFNWKIFSEMASKLGTVLSNPLYSNKNQLKMSGRI